MLIPLRQRKRQKPLKRVTVLTDWWSPNYLGGAERTLESAMRNLVHQGYEVSVVTMRNRGERRENVYVDSEIYVLQHRSLTLRSARKFSLLISVLERLRLGLDFISPRFAVKAVSQTKPDLVFLGPIDRYGPRTVSLLSRRLSGVPLIRSFHDFSDLCIFRSRYRKGALCENTCHLCKYREYNYRRVDSLIKTKIFISQFVRSKFTQQGFRANNTAVGNPSIARVSEIPGGKRNLNDSASKTVGYVGRIHPTKGIESLLRASAIQPRLDVLCVGNGNAKYIEKLLELARSLEVSLTIQPFLEDPYEFLREKVKLIAVLSFWEEPYGRVPVEAANYGIPTVVSEFGGLPESGSRCHPEPIAVNPYDIVAIRDAFDSSPTVSILKLENLGPTFNDVCFSEVESELK